METIWEYLTAKGYNVIPRGEKKVVHLVLEQEKLNPTQKSRMGARGITMEKLDGVYSIVTLINDEVRHWGRSGKALQNTKELDHFFMSQWLTLYSGRNFIFSSEITSDDPLAKLSGYLTPARVNDVSFTPTNMKDNLFDMLDVDEFVAGYSGVTYKTRLETLRSLVIDTPIGRIPYLYMSFGNALRLAKSYWEEGKEGLVFSQLGAPWKAGAKDESRIKFKEKLSFDCTVVGYTSGRKGTKYETTLGKLIVAFPVFGDSNNLFVELPVSGMTDAQRALWFDNPALIIGACVKVDAKSYTETGNLREARYKETREDKPSDFPVVFEPLPPDTFVKNQATYTVSHWVPKVELDRA